MSNDVSILILYFFDGFIPLPIDNMSCHSTKRILMKSLQMIFRIKRFPLYVDVVWKQRKTNCCVFLRIYLLIELRNVLKRGCVTLLWLEIQTNEHQLIIYLFIWNAKFILSDLFSAHEIEGHLSNCCSFAEFTLEKQCK